eukprot:4179874-Alexandrium_andersonii.AAC.1
MRVHAWQELGGERVQVCLDARDLGAHVSFSKGLRSGTLAARMRKAAVQARRVASLPAAAAKKASATLQKFVPMAMYGVESTPVVASALSTLSAGLKHAVAQGTKSVASSSLVFALLGKKSPSPVWHALLLRVKQVRKMWHSHVDMMARLDATLVQLVAEGAPGACKEGEEPAFVREGICGEVPWSSEGSSEVGALGPVSLMLLSLQRAGFRVDGEWRVYAEFTPVFSLVQEPWNSVVALLRERHLQASVVEAASRRDTLRGQ